MRFRDARAGDVPAIAGLQNAAAGALTTRYGIGPWSALVTERAITASLRDGRTRVGVSERQIVTVLRLATRKPWAIDVSYFTSVKAPLYLTGMAVSVAQQGKGCGRAAIDDAISVASEWPADAIRLDAYDAQAGAAGFYIRCGFTDCGHVAYKGNPLVYLEYLLAAQ